ncbi:hypothetical protein PMIN06_004825 [Paraphaeosphaeria minitans]|uniref:Uncharacterized protein n=1 Tax=Paraphaeosphaeria minitans TaxID=565426 RepID=A0A9P6GK26_9PLEO|nr:hypothetical protein PMIN01_04322 [Paraphaeosphaeria minitans]
MPPLSSPSSTPSRPTFTFPTLGNTSNTEFTFRILPRPEAPLSFPPGSPPSPPCKRRRATADVDGEHSCLHKKKRRLRLFLITSRLSPQFSHPATNIVDRGSSKIAVWAKQRALGRNILRKAAILNRIRWKSICALEMAGGRGRVFVEQKKEQEQLQLARLALLYGSRDSATQPIRKEDVGLPEVIETRTGEQVRSGGSSPASSTGSSSPPLDTCDVDSASEYRSPNDAYAYSSISSKPPRPAHLPLPPSPLGLSNYDALDLEDEIPDPYAHLDEEYEAAEQEECEADIWYPLEPPFPFQPRHVDVNVLGSEERVIGDYDQVEEGADAIWPAVRQTHSRITDAEPPSSSSPNFTATNTAQIAVARSHNASSSLSPTSSSPNFADSGVTRDAGGTSSRRSMQLI